MLTRLKVKGFKNLVDVDVHFGPFTCIAGANGTGKSNLFDAIRFLSALADSTFVEAALSVRDPSQKSGDLRSIFHRTGDSIANRIFLEAEVIVAPEGLDELNQSAVASMTFLRYRLELGYRDGAAPHTFGPIELITEELEHITKGQAHAHLLFSHSAKEWRDSVVRVERRRNDAKFISTINGNDSRDKQRLIRLHQDGGSSGRPREFLAHTLPKTVLSTTNAIESPTALLLRREMQGWRLLQLSPTAMRKPDEFNAPTRLGDDGAYLASTLYNLAQTSGDPDRVYAQLTNRLSELIDEVRDLWVDRDERRELFTLYVRDTNGVAHSARALSDGTLRFLALAVLEMTSSEQRLICLEEPENGIHPARIPAMLRLLQDIATDTDYRVDHDNPLRQVMINTHSPVVVQEVPDDSLMVAELTEIIDNGERFKGVEFSPMAETWRIKAAGYRRSVSPGKLSAYLNPTTEDSAVKPNGGKPKRRVRDYPDLQPMLPGFSEHDIKHKA